uniref:Reverse transcriptase domain-containing protein n=1 Tax=Amphimedon queenslandica TaxID=400682 RepID=A0A1X7V4N1_AMPQE
MGDKFIKLDLSQAYQQMQVHPSSKELVNMNTHKGLFRYTGLPFGVASIPVILQRAIDNILQAIFQVHCYIDNILILGSNDHDCLKNLKEILQRLHKNGITVKKSKCFFLQDSVEYFGHALDKEGSHAAPEKLKAIQEAPTPINIRELRSCLGLIISMHGFKWIWCKDCQKAF